MFPPEYRNDAFATMRGSWSRDPAAGYEIVRIRFDAQGQPRAIEPFANGFLTDGDKTHFARPMDQAVARDGALLMADDANGLIYRVAYARRSASPAAAPATPPPQAMERQGNEGCAVPLVLQRPELRQPRGEVRALQVESPDFLPGGVMPMIHSSYANNVSPALHWQPVKGVASYAVIVEDPDSRPSPTVHWVVYDRPATAASFAQGIQVQPRLTEPYGVLRGRNTRGVAGYYGPHPPAGDPPHHYHFQVLALDTMPSLKPGARRDEVLAAARGHVVAAGEVVGTYQQVQKPPN
jgi:Raf kinase inhibitor-like YbhB/YbcL family protein